MSTVPHKGPVVSRIDAEEAREIYDVRAMLEGYCGRAFAGLAGEEEIAELRGIAETIARAAGAEELLAAKAAFYDALIAGARNAVVGEILTALHNRVSRLRRLSAGRAGRVAGSVAEIRAIAARDPDAVERAYRDHVEAAAHAALAQLAKDAG